MKQGANARRGAHVRAPGPLAVSTACAAALCVVVYAYYLGVSPRGVAELRRRASVNATGPRTKKHANSSSIIKLEQALWAELDARAPSAAERADVNLSRTAKRFGTVERYPYDERFAAPPIRTHPVLGHLHSQFRQEQMVFDRYHQGIPHTFVEFGCRNGIEHSNTLSLELFGWTGLCIEAIETISASRRNRHQGAVCNPEREGEEVTFDISLPGLHGMQVSISARAC